MTHGAAIVMLQSVPVRPMKDEQQPAVPPGRVPQPRPPHDPHCVSQQMSPFCTPERPLSHIGPGISVGAPVGDAVGDAV